MLKHSIKKAVATFSSRTKWLWLALLTLFGVGALVIVLFSPPARRPAAIHFIAMHTGAFVGYSLFAVLLASGIKSILKVQWAWHDWVNSVVVLTAIIFVFRLSSANAPDDNRQSVELSPKLITKEDVRVASIVGSWRCKAASTGASFLVTYDFDGRMAIAALGATTPVVDGPVRWDIEDGNLLLHRYADGERFTKSRIMRLTPDSFATLATNGSEVLCDQISPKGGS